MADRATLEKWIADTERNQRVLFRALAPGVLVAAALLAWSRPIGGGALVLVALVALFGYWITSSHIAEWRNRIEELDRPAPAPVNRLVRRQ